MSKLLVTGGAGFIGSNFIRYWLDNHPDDHVVNLDLLTYAGNVANLKDIEPNPNYTFIKGDIRDQALVDELVKGVDIIVHFAAETHVDRSILGPEAFIETNIKGTYVLLEAARRHGKHFHHISTDEVFGSLDLHSTEKFTEDTPYRPHSPYSASKAASDHLVRAYHETFGLPVTITNCSNNFGPYQHPEKFIPRMITNLLDGQNVKIYGDGLYVRDWLYVTDHCRAIDLVLQRGNPLRQLADGGGGTYVVGGMHEEVNNLAVAKELLRYLNLPESRIDYVTDRPGHDRRYAVDWSKIKRELGWEPAHSFQEWLHRTIEWYQQHEAWWRPLKEEAEKLYAKTGQ
ncbi:MAG TPA: dTDP-glucose 4,6-dehydratase [Candidatus Andersenbacteria bacterium]|nr:dTDP-glucose 4,6-dehydratase [Candidatus Andersenbacteria bacterium]